MYITAIKHKEYMIEAWITPILKAFLFTSISAEGASPVVYIDQLNLTIHKLNSTY